MVAKGKDVQDNSEELLLQIYRFPKTSTAKVDAYCGKYHQDRSAVMRLLLIKAIENAPELEEFATEGV